MIRWQRATATATGRGCGSTDYTEVAGAASGV
jgi:hypothetical protein